MKTIYLTLFLLFLISCSTGKAVQVLERPDDGDLEGCPVSVEQKLACNEEVESPSIQLQASFPLSGSLEEIRNFRALVENKLWELGNTACKDLDCKEPCSPVLKSTRTYENIFNNQLIEEDRRITKYSSHITCKCAYPGESYEQKKVEEFNLCGNNFIEAGEDCENPNTFEYEQALLKRGGVVTIIYVCNSSCKLKTEQIWGSDLFKKKLKEYETTGFERRTVMKNEKRN